MHQALAQAQPPGAVPGTPAPSAAPAPGRALSLLEMRDAVFSGDPLKQRALAFSELPEGATLATIDLYSGGMMASAFALNELAQAEVILRRWLRLNPSNSTPRMMLMVLLAQGLGTQIEEALAMGAAGVAAAQLPSEKVTSRAALAELHLRVGEQAQAARVLAEARGLAEGELRNWGLGGARAYFVPFAQFTYHLADCRLALARMQLESAETACRQSLAFMRTAWDNRRALPPVHQIIAATRLAEVQLVLAEVQLARNQHHDAEATVGRALAEARANNANPYLKFQADDLIWRIRMAQGDLSPLRTLRAEVLKAATSAGVSTVSLGFITFRRNFQTGLVLMRDWPAALAEFDRGDSLLVNADPLLRQAARNLVPRVLAWHMGGRDAQVISLLDAELAASSADFGAGHARTALLRGLRARSAAAGQSGAALAAPVGELARAAQVLMDPAAPGAEQLDRAELALARQMVLQAFVDLAADSGDASHATLAFRAADALRVNSVQQAVTDAAVRAAASTQGLADVVRRDQDARNELQALYDFIAGQAAELEPQRRDGVVAQMKTRIAELQALRAQTRADIARQFPQYDRLVRPQAAGADTIAAQLKPGESFVALLPTARHVHVWAVSAGTGGGAGGTRYHRAALDEAALQALVGRLRRTLDVAGDGERAPAFDAAAASALYQQLMRPVLGDTAPRHLVVSAAGALSQIPFAVLLREPVARADAQAPWLIRDSAISHTASASAWLASRGSRSPGGAMTLAAWADPLFDRAGARPQAKAAVRALQVTRNQAAPTGAITYASVPPLPETRDEVAAIARSLGADPQRDALYGEQATRESVLQASRSGALAGRRVIVFATHGLVAGDLPNLTQPALAMAATGREAQEPMAPLLTLQDVLSLRLDADWVVLSACNTAAADGRAGEALSGLARGFFYAGGRSLLVTHWAVESDSATLLTTGTFAHQAANPGTSRAESLRQAMLKVMAQPRYTHPAFWAPYALVGEGG